MPPVSSKDTATEECRASKTIRVTGIVQGVGFRPFVYRLARDMGLKGFVRNTARGVEIHIEGDGASGSFVERLRGSAPPNARIDRIEVHPDTPRGYADFAIDTTSAGDATVFAPPDLFTCGECLQELFRPADRRYRYPFINCTNCGPRYSIIRGLPYDRVCTTMTVFRMCPRCDREYRDPSDRRFHAEPNACPECGPGVSFLEGGEAVPGGIQRAVERMRQGKVLALKGIGGFHLICDARNARAVHRLRELKERERKPFALMARDLGAVEAIASVTVEEKAALLSAQRPIVLVRKRAEIEGISPGIPTYGIMLPYTPLHALIMEELPVVVATSANLRESPIPKDESEGVRELSDCLLTHNRDIAMRCDDSVVRLAAGRRIFVRRARGFVPSPLGLHFECRGRILSLGGELKNTVSILKDGYIITSQYLGDMKDLRNRQYLEEVIAHFSTLYAFAPDVVTCDLHPDFTTTRMAEGWGKPVVRVQHHMAHVFAVLAEHGLSPEEPFLGVAFDGVGYGEDGRIWGGEFFVGGCGRMQRAFHFRYVPQQGGDLATLEPWRMALGYTMDAFGKPVKMGVLARVDEKTLTAAGNAIQKRMNSPLTSSVGRLFDAVSAILGIAPLRIDYEAEAAMRLEGIACEDAQEHYPFEIRGDEIDMRETIRAIVEDSAPPAVISGKFHETIARVILTVCEASRKRYGIQRVVLSGGVFLNAVLLARVITGLRQRGVEVYVPEKLSPGDEAISVGQCYVAALHRGDA